MGFEELKQRQSVMWGNGVFERVAATIAAPPSNPLDWGRKERIQALLGDAFELVIEEHETMRRYATAEEHWELFATSFGPVKSLAESLGDRRDELHRAWVDFFEREFRVDGEIVDAKEYLLVLGTRR